MREEEYSNKIDNINHPVLNVFFFLQVLVLFSILCFVNLGSSFSTSKHFQVDNQFGKVDFSRTPNPKICGECVQFSEKFMTKLIAIAYGKNSGPS